MARRYTIAIVTLLGLWFMFPPGGGGGTAPSRYA